jgi:hypothetical protein
MKEFIIYILGCMSGSALSIFIFSCLMSARKGDEQGRRMTNNDKTEE